MQKNTELKDLPSCSSVPMSLPGLSLTLIWRYETFYIRSVEVDYLHKLFPNPIMQISFKQQQQIVVFRRVSEHSIVLIWQNLTHIFHSCSVCVHLSFVICFEVKGIKIFVVRETEEFLPLTHQELFTINSPRAISQWYSVWKRMQDTKRLNAIRSHHLRSFSMQADLLDFDLNLNHISKGIKE